MAGEDRFDARMRAMLEGLSPAARAMILRGAAEGETPAARPALPVTPEAAASLLQAAFFAPIEMFVVDGRPMNRERARIPRGDCDQLWKWFSRDVAPQQIQAALIWAAARPADFDRKVEQLRVTVLAAAADKVARVAATPLEQQRLAAQIGGDGGFRVLTGILTAFGQSSQVTESLARLPARIDRAMIEREPETLTPLSTLVMRRPEENVWVLSGLMPRLESPILLARIATLLTGTDDGGKLQATALAPAIDLLFSEIELAVEELRAHRENRAQIERSEAALGRFHYLVRELGIVVDLNNATAWTRRLATVKMVASAQIEKEIVGAPGLLRRTLRSRSAMGTGLTLEPDLFEDAERSLRFLVIATAAKESLALNAVIATARRDVDQSFQVLLTPLFDELHGAQGEARDVLLKRTDVAVRLAEIYFGSAYAATLRRSQVAATVDAGRGTIARLRPKSA